MDAVLGPLGAIRLYQQASPSQPGALGQARLLVLAAPHAAADAMFELAAYLAQHRPIQVLDGGNRFNAYQAARAIGRLNPANVQDSLERILVARAFTCYQMFALLEQTAAQHSALPTLVLDLLSTFSDQSVALAERRRLLEQAIRHLRCLSRQAGVVVSLRPPRGPDREAAELHEMVLAAAGQVWMPETPPAAARQLNLF